MKLFSGLKARKLSKAIENSPGDFKNYRDLITLHLDERDYQDAMECIEKARQQIWNASDQMWLNVQAMKIQRSHPERSADAFDSALRVFENASAETAFRIEAAEIVASMILSGQICRSEAELLQTAGLFDSLLNEVSGNDVLIPLSISAAELSAKAGDPGSGLKRLEPVLRSIDDLRYKNAGKIFLRAAELSRLAGNLPGERRKIWLVRAIESGHLTDDETVNALIGIAGILQSENDLLGAMERLETALRFAGHSHSKETVSVRVQLAKIYYRLSRIPQAIKEVSQALEGDLLTGDERADVLLWLAGVKEAQDQFEQAESMLNSAADAARGPEKKIEILKKRALVQEKQGTISAAIATIDQAISINPEQPDSELLFAQARLFNVEGIFHKSLKLLKQLDQNEEYRNRIGNDMLLLETARAYLGQQKLIKALETFLEIPGTSGGKTPAIDEARRQLMDLKKQLSQPEALKQYKLDGPDRKALAVLMDRIPDTEDFFSRLRTGLRKTRSGFVLGIERILKGRTSIDASVLDEIEELMILSDLGVETTTAIIDGLREKLARKELNDPGIVRTYIRTEIERILSGHSGRLVPDAGMQPWVIMIVGVNGVGKTTTIAKIARRFSEQGRSVLMAAGDTFRAGAIEQLKEWGKRLDVDVISHDEGADPSAVAWDAVAAAKSRNVDVLIIDTAGRLHTKSNLMEELKKVQRVIGKNMPGAPHEILLVLDATTGQNAVMQAREFCQTVNVSGLVLTKLDGTAKGGIIVSIVQELNIPIKLIGIGERMDDLRDFDAESFSKALFDDSADSTEMAETSV